MQPSRLTRYARRLALIAVGLELVVSANLLSAIGVSYVTDGGPLLAKLHPASSILAVAFVLALFGGGQAWLRRIDKLLWLFAAALCGCVMFMLLLTSASDLIVLFDTFLPAGLLAAIVSHGPGSMQRRLRQTLQVLLFGNAVLALGEISAQSNLVPLFLNDAVYHAESVDFRPTALFDHPLTGAMMMMIALAVAPQGRSRMPYQLVVWAALIAFGGRTALAITLAGVIGTAVHRHGRRILLRDRTATLTVLLAIAGFGCGVLLAAVALASGFGSRLAGHLYWDASAQVRLAQWQILGQLDIWQILFGISREHLLANLNVLSLGSGVRVIENFWLLMFVSLGVVGFPMFLLMFGSLCAWCWRASSTRGRVLLLSIVIAASSSNSLGRKSTLLVCLVAAVTSLTRAAAIPEAQAVTRRGGSRVQAPHGHNPELAWRGELA